MLKIDSSIITQNKPYAIGVSDMKNHTGRLLNVCGNTILICQSGQAIISLYWKRHIFKKGDVIDLYPDMVPKILNVSNDFSCFYYILSCEYSNEV